MRSPSLAVGWHRGCHAVPCGQADRQACSRFSIHCGYGMANLDIAAFCISVMSLFGPVMNIPAFWAGVVLPKAMWGTEVVVVWPHGICHDTGQSATSAAEHAAQGGIEQFMAVVDTPLVVDVRIADQWNSSCHQTRLGGRSLSSQANH